MRKPRRRGSSPASTRRAPRRRQRDPFIVTRADGYIGVMIDDLVTRGVDRALPHVHLARRVSADAARRQCRPAADAAWASRPVASGGARADAFAAKARSARPTARRCSSALTLTPDEAAKAGLAVNRDGRRRSAFELLAIRRSSSRGSAAIWPEIGRLDARIAAQLAVDARYAVYLEAPGDRHRRLPQGRGDRHSRRLRFRGHRRALQRAAPKARARRGPRASARRRGSTA